MLDPQLRKEANAQFIIRMIDQNKTSKLIGAGQLHKYLGKGGPELSIKLAKRAFDALPELSKCKWSIKLRRGVRIDFYIK